jgi:glycosyltransferase involved in cell wall biosynthesis
MPALQALFLKEFIVGIGKRALVVGAARNCVQGLRATLPRLERLQDSFESVKYVIVTNDSNDGTPDVLRDWAKRVPNVELVCLDGLVYSAPNRTARLAVIRNICLSELWRRDEAFDFLIVADLDGLNETLIDEPAFSQVIKDAPGDWSALFANQRGDYYDVWALRHPVWSPDDCIAQMKAYARKWRWLRTKRGAMRAGARKYVLPRQKPIDPSSPPILVDSAFGGFGIYKTNALAGAYYVGLNASGREICEHVSFNKAIRSNGGQLYVLPGLLNA